jgi:hypothetical protein
MASIKFARMMFHKITSTITSPINRNQCDNGISAEKGLLAQSVNSDLNDDHISHRATFAHCKSNVADVIT